MNFFKRRFGRTPADQASLLSDWNYLKAKVYFDEGSALDIVVEDFAPGDWDKWAQLVEEEYPFYDGTLDMNLVRSYWLGERDEGASVIFGAGNIRIGCWYLDEDKFENVVYPDDYKSLHDHETLMEYLQQLSLVLGKKVFLAPENSHHISILEVSGETITLP